MVSEIYISSLHLIKHDPEKKVMIPIDTFSIDQRKKVMSQFAVCPSWKNEEEESIFLPTDSVGKPEEVYLFLDRANIIVNSRMILLNKRLFRFFMYYWSMSVESMFIQWNVSFDQSFKQLQLFLSRRTHRWTLWNSLRIRFNLCSIARSSFQRTWHSAKTINRSLAISNCFWLCFFLDVSLYYHLVFMVWSYSSFSILFSFGNTTKRTFDRTLSDISSRR